MKGLAILAGVTGILAAQTPGSMNGTLSDTSGVPVSGAIVTAYSQVKTTDGKFPPVFNTTTGSDGSFVFTGLAPGAYVLCADKPDIALLNPCLWSATKTSTTVPAGGSATGVSLVAEKGVALTIRVNDAKGLLTANPVLDDVAIGVKAAVGPPLPGGIASKDAAGRTLTVVVRQGQPVDILVYSANLQLADAKGTAFAAPNTKVTVTAPVAAVPPSSSQIAGTPDVTINVQGQVQKP